MLMQKIRADNKDPKVMVGNHDSHLTENLIANPMRQWPLGRHLMPLSLPTRLHWRKLPNTRPLHPGEVHPLVPL